MLTVTILREPGTDDLPLPRYQTNGAAGMDVHAAVTDPVQILPGARVAIPTGIQIAIPPGYEAQLRGRSGLARNFGVTLANGIGTIDSDYRGPIQVLLINHGAEPFTVGRGDRIAQMVVAPVVQVVWQEAETLTETVRGGGGFGHTGSQPTGTKTTQ